jgi:hypothetical protein
MTTISDTVPNGISPDSCRRFLDTRDPEFLIKSFQWSSTPKGGDYWAGVYSGRIYLTDEDITLLEGWILESTFPQ